MPSVKQWTSYVTVEVDSNEIVTCEAFGQPTPKITWYRKNEDVLAPIGSRAKQLDLNLTRARQRDAGIYQCIAVNKHGRIEKILNVTVLGEDIWEPGM